jgi:hypothetical protein
VFGRDRYDFASQSFEGAFKGWGYQDFAAGAIVGTSATLSDNENGDDIVFEASKVVGSSVVIVRSDDPTKRVFTGATAIISSVVTATNAGANPEDVTLSGIPHNSYSVRIYFCYIYEDGIPANYSIPPKSVIGAAFAELDIMLITEQELTDGSKTPVFDDLTINNPSNIYALSHDSFADFVANEHIDWTNATSRLLTTLATEQMRLCYDATSYTSFVVDADGALTTTSTDALVFVSGGGTFIDIKPTGAAQYISIRHDDDGPIIAAQGGDLHLQATGGDVDFAGTTIKNAVEPDWDTAYDNMVTAIGWTAATGVITLTQQDAGTLTVDIGLGTGDSPTFAGLTTGATLFKGNITLDANNTYDFGTSAIYLKNLYAGVLNATYFWDIAGTSTGITFSAGDVIVYASGTEAMKCTQGAAGPPAGARAWVVINEQGNDQDFRVEGDTDVFLINTDAANNRVGIGDSAPGEKLDVAGNVNVTGVYKVDDTQVVKEQQAHIADATTQDLAGSDTIDETKLESDLTGIVSAINSILSALETHGLLANA